MIHRYRKKWREGLKSQSGITLIEMVVAVVVAGIITVTIMPFVQTSVDSYISARAGKELLQSARIGFNRLVAELRLIESPGSGINWAYSSRIDFNIPGDNGITYRFQSQALTREGVELVIGVEDFVITYYRADGTSFTPGFFNTRDVWRMHIEMKVGTEDKSIVFQSQVMPRNFPY